MFVGLVPYGVCAVVALVFREAGCCVAVCMSGSLAVHTANQHLQVASGRAPVIFPIVAFGVVIVVLQPCL